ncbi:unnamed protein product [Linum trigynum]|uniref:Reverse transcriptase zinc-binding domain-containing protein n=1 Tax=Linum trigynum TaxID=586398 RepID=A0AAV2D281_9ROSI
MRGLGYDMMDSVTDDMPLEAWRDLWRWDGPNIIKLFLWLISHNRLLTNAQRKKQQIAQNEGYNHCTDEEDTLEHILRKCKKTKGFCSHFKWKIT